MNRKSLLKRSMLMSRLALGSPSCLVGRSLITVPEIPYNTLKYYIFEKPIKTDLPNCQIHKYTITNTNTQIQLC